MKKNNKSNLAKVMVLTLALIVLGISSTYAFFINNITGEAKDTSLTAGSLQIDTNIETVSAINETNLKLINHDDRVTSAKSVQFYIKSTENTNVDANYAIYLRELTLSKNLYDEYFKWELLQNNEVVGEGTFAAATRIGEEAANEEANVSTTAEDIQLNNKKDLILNKQNTAGDTLIFRIWLENNPSANQISLTNGSFSGKLYLEATPVSANKK